MNGKTALSPVTQAGAEKRILSVEKPQTQTVEAVKALLSWRGRASDPLPEFVELSSNGSREEIARQLRQAGYKVVE